MKKLIILFLALFAAFLLLWGYKISTPLNRPDEYADGYDADAGAWWKTGEVKVDDTWTLDRDVPVNYKPVPGQDNLYMVVDKDGKILKYMKRTKQIDGSWKWEEVNPDIPENYEAVEGLDNVYRVISPEGTVSYYKYVRNDDDTFAWIAVDENGNILDYNTDATTIDGKHVHISGNIYELLDDNGVVIGYDRRIENPDGTFSWTLTEMPSLSDAAGDFSLSESGLPSMGSAVDSSLLDQMAAQMAAANAAANAGSQDVYNITYNINNGAGTGAGSQPVDLTPNVTNIVNQDGTHTEVEVFTETKTIEGYTATYETMVTRTYDDAGNLIASDQKGPYLVNNTQALTTESAPVQGDKSKKEDTIDREAARVTGSYSYNDSLASEVVTKLNAYRVSKGLGTLQVTDLATKIAKLRAADMAGYNTSAEDLPTYGSLGTMLTEYNCMTSAAGENIWKTYTRTAEEIDTMFLTDESARKTRVQDDATQVGVAIINGGNGTMYICEVIL